MNFHPQIALLLHLALLSKKWHMEGSSVTLTDWPPGSSFPTSKEITLLVSICRLTHIRLDTKILKKD